MARFQTQLSLFIELEVEKKGISDVWRIIGILGIFLDNRDKKGIEIFFFFLSMPGIGSNSLMELF